VGRFRGAGQAGGRSGPTLELIDELGSIKKAVDRLGMSYRSAWGYLKELEKAAGFKLLARTPGRRAAGGTRLTRAGRQFLIGIGASAGGGRGGQASSSRGRSKKGSAFLRLSYAVENI